MPTEVDSIIQYLKEAFDYLMSPELQNTLVPLQVACFLFFFGFLAVWLVLLFKTEYITWTPMEFFYDFFKAPKILGNVLMVKKWNKIKKGVESRSEAKRKLALIDAHVLLEQTLKKMGYGGFTVEERLGHLTADQIGNLEDLKKAESFCRDIFANPEKELTNEKAKQVINTFAKAFVDLEVF